MMFVAPGETEWGKARAWEYQREHPGETIVSVQSSPVVVRPGVAVMVDPEVTREIVLPPFEHPARDQDAARRFAIATMRALTVPSPPALLLRVQL